MCSLFALLLVAAVSPAVARDHSGSSHARSHGSHSSYAYPRYSHGGSRYNHHYHYPSRGYYSSRYYGAPYYYHGSSWYRPYGVGYVVAAPAIGIGFSWYGGWPYYYADHGYYPYRSETREYVVAETARASDEVFVYPKEGQSDERQSIDRDECHQWAVARTGFDPGRPAVKRADYRRAEAACLEGRGYTVR